MYHIHPRSFPLRIFMLWFIIPYRLKKVLFIFTIFVQISEFYILTIPHRLLLLFAPPPQGTYLIRVKRIFAIRFATRLYTE